MECINLNVKTMNFGNYIYQDTSQGAKDALVNQLIDSSNKLEAGHLKAVEVASELEKSIAALDMNEAEDGFKQQLVQELKDTIENNIQYGNMYFALDDIIKTSGNIMSNPQVIGKLRAQKQYTSFQDFIDKTNIIPDYMKPMYKKLNNYTYNDIYDDNGKIIGGSKWTPKYSPVQHIDETKIFEQALKLIKPTTNHTYGNYIFVDGEGNQIDPLKVGANIKDIKLYDKITGNTTVLERYHIKQALEGLYDSNQSIQQSVKQEMLYSEYNDKNPSTNKELYYSSGEEKGHIKSQKDYFLDKYGNAIIASAFKETAHAHNWQNFNSSLTSGNGGGIINNFRNQEAEQTIGGTTTVERSKLDKAKENSKRANDLYNQATR